MALPAAGIRAVSPGVATAKANGGGSSASIVGMWKIQFISQGNSASTPAIPDGAVVDFGYTQLHSDGTELLNSGAHTPSTQNFCLGVWGQTGFLSYELNHFALSYNSLTGELANYVNIKEQLTLSPSGDMFSGTFTIDIYDTNQNHFGSCHRQCYGDTSNSGHDSVLTLGWGCRSPQFHIVCDRDVAQWTCPLF